MPVQRESSLLGFDWPQLRTKMWISTDDPNTTIIRHTVMTVWKTIDTYPFDGTRVLVWSRLEGERDDGPTPLPAYCDAEDGIWWLAQGLEEVDSPDWWMPLPPPPDNTDV